MNNFSDIFLFINDRVYRLKQNSKTVEIMAIQELRFWNQNIQYPINAAYIDSKNILCKSCIVLVNVSLVSLL